MLLKLLSTMSDLFEELQLDDDDDDVVVRLPDTAGREPLDG